MKMDKYICIEISMSGKTQEEKDYEYHDVFMRQFKFYFTQVGHDFENAIFRAHHETWFELAEQSHYEKLDKIFTENEEGHNKPLPDKCLITDSDEEDNSPKKNNKLRSVRTLKALKEIIDELNKSIEVLQEENKKLKKDNEEWQEKCIYPCKKGIEFAEEEKREREKIHEERIKRLESFKR